MPLLACGKVGLLCTVTLGCCGPFGLTNDGGSVSWGRTSRGGLRHGRRLSAAGPGYIVPTRWRVRGHQYGTSELVGLIRRVAAHVQDIHGPSYLGVGDMSSAGGGALNGHHSHQSGRDVDLIFYQQSSEGVALVPTEMIPFDQGGSPKSANRAIRLDVARTWTLVRLLLTDPHVQVQWVFVSLPLIQTLLQHARTLETPAFLIEHAETVLHTPRDSRTHDDHIHLRIFCDPADRQWGCADEDPARWLKSSLKYDDAPDFRQPALRLLREPPPMQKRIPIVRYPLW